jgi:hypothetical protein
MAPGKPHEIPLTQQAETLLEALEACGPGWHTRSTIARKLDKTRLNGFDVALLEVLREAGRIEVEKRETRGPIGYTWQYRLSD